MTRFYLSNIFQSASVRTAFYEAKNKPYFKGVNELLKVKNKKHKGLSFMELERLLNAFIEALKIKHHHKSGRIARDKSNLMKAYLNLFAFVEKLKKGLI
ncbi:hypothetical protein [Campylobacter vulpis]|uniref:hypothetical protein n=1 Tax=Campylobacter vulpis TaxID=1655500 RepID=UPI000C159F0B|nr:hypothetical protein [Campylobacter vulpis]MBS4275603.1 hypothetical protein [Campylobacter vulpis]MBS4306814.1 hypothetical protein [Campylobacter vulpis]MBS4329922.1 hypothetical protein [Campylobacter vulpis]MBS4423569.1 hypothetical protein [Campylobacter vulpis]PHY89912.1 hypothetical protein AA995_07175 [Campylobacter vulpis]